MQSIDQALIGATHGEAVNLTGLSRQEATKSKNSFLQRLAFAVRFHHVRRLAGLVREGWLYSWGMRVGKGTVVPRLFITWPHQVAIGSNCSLEEGIRFKFDGIWQSGPSIQIKDRVFLGSGCEFNISESITIGSDSLIASGCRFIDHDHGTAMSGLIREQLGPTGPITLEENVWLGCNVVVLKGVTIGSGAVVAAGAVVNKSVPSNEIWAGVPARKIGQRS